MAVRLVEEIEKVVDREADLFVQKVVMTEKSLAPWDTGRLANSIHPIKQGLANYIITTDAVGDNDVAYPARIEAGDAVYPTGKYVHNFYDGRGLVPAIYFKGKWHEFARASKQSGFAQKTVSRYK